MKYAFKIAYFGENFFGSQYQPDLRTVEGEIRRAFQELGINSKPRFAGRTDAGVSALGQVIAFESEKEIRPRILNSVLPSDITAWAYKEVPESFNPRKAKSRVYSYVFLNEDFDIERMERAVELLKGVHDFSNFTKKWKGGKREIFDAKLFSDGEFLIFEIEGNAFTWNMVRCIVTALKLVGSGKPLEWFEKMLDPSSFRERIPPSPPEGLMLKEVKYDFDFEVDEVGLKLLRMRIEKRLKHHGTIYKLLSLKLDALDSGKKQN
uniref:tRNA pseudouridine synthase A n=1 Tax=Archaeoglobus fulgidus TaxID=2234 RepID=A0A7J2TIU0_ARCFL